MPAPPQPRHSRQKNGHFSTGQQLPTALRVQGGQVPRGRPGRLLPQHSPLSPQARIPKNPLPADLGTAGAARVSPEATLWHSPAGNKGLQAAPGEPTQCLPMAEHPRYQPGSARRFQDQPAAWHPALLPRVERWAQCSTSARRGKMPALSLCPSPTLRHLSSPSDCRALSPQTPAAPQGLIQTLPLLRLCTAWCMTGTQSSWDGPSRMEKCLYPASPPWPRGPCFLTPNHPPHPACTGPQQGLHNPAPFL